MSVVLLLCYSTRNNPWLLHARLQFGHHVDQKYGLYNVPNDVTWVLVLHETFSNWTVVRVNQIRYTRKPPSLSPRLQFPHHAHQTYGLYNAPNDVTWMTFLCKTLCSCPNKTNYLIHRGLCGVLLLSGTDTCITQKNIVHSAQDSFISPSCTLKLWTTMFPQNDVTWMPSLYKTFLNETFCLSKTNV